MAITLFILSHYLSSFSNPVRAAYIASLESQISSLRDELATVYKTQGQNAQRLLAMTETLREKEEMSRIESENLRKAQDEASTLGRKVEQHDELMSEKDRTAQVSCASSPFRFTVLISLRFYTMRSTHYNLSLDKSMSVIRYWSRTMPNCYSDGLTRNKKKSIR